MSTFSGRLTVSMVPWITSTMPPSYKHHNQLNCIHTLLGCEGEQQNIPGNIRARRHRNNTERPPMRPRKVIEISSRRYPVSAWKKQGHCRPGRGWTWRIFRQPHSVSACREANQEEYASSAHAVSSGGCLQDDSFCMQKGGRCCLQYDSGVGQCMIFMLRFFELRHRGCLA